jgi:hypothetical protein
MQYLEGYWDQEASGDFKDYGDNNDWRFIYQRAIDIHTYLLYNTVSACLLWRLPMTKLYKFLDDKQKVVRIFSNKDEAIGFSLVDRSLKIETIKLSKRKMKDDVYSTHYELLGKGIVWDAIVVIKY